MSALSREELAQLLGLSLHAGKLMLENGANTSRVEDVVSRIGRALGAERLDVYVTPSGIVVTALAGDEHRTRIVRILRTGVDLNRVASVVELTDRAEREQLSLQQVTDALNAISRQPRLYGPLVLVPAVGVACAAFALLFGCSGQGALAAGAAAAAGQALREILGRFEAGRLLTTVIVAFATSTLALLNASLIASQEAGLVVAASVLLLIPGVLMVSSVGDLFRGDTLSGLSRATNAALVILAIAAGISLTLVVFHAPLVPGPSHLDLPWAEVLLALVASAGFALLFDVPKRALWTAPLVGALAYGVKAAASSAGAGPESSVFFAGLVLALVAEGGGRALKLPSNIFTIPAFIPLIPGVAAFRCVLHFTRRDFQAGIASLVETVLWVGALAAGMGAVQAVVSRSHARHAERATVE